MLAISMRLTIALHSFLQYVPTNLILSRLRSRHGLKWGVPFMFLGAAYFFAAAMLTSWLHGGGPGWLNLLVLLSICYAVFAVMPMLWPKPRFRAVVWGPGSA